MQHCADHDADRRRIIEVTYCCLSEPHPGPILMSEILRRARVSTRAFYRHFDSKDDLFLALLQQETDALVTAVDRIAEEAVGSPADQLAAWIGEMFDMCADPRRRMQLAVIDSDEVRAAKGYREARERGQADRERSLTEILRRGRADGSLPLADPDFDAAAISIVVARVLAAQEFEHPQDLRQAQRQTLDFALRSVGAVVAT
ncbi:MAG: TetR/AcrR family transcriptional regulator [Actinomycetota bacterium]|nr:TetR/AcrR family transcriptional regulator [Actinomycetota bacterium]